MKKRFRQFCCAILALCACLTTFGAIPASAATEDDIALCFNNVHSVVTSMNINADGQLTILYTYDGFSDRITETVIVTCVEKKVLGLFWQHVDIGTSDNQWVDTTDASDYTSIRTYQLPSSGTYRVTVTYTIYGTDGVSDVVEHQRTGSY